MKKVYEKVYQNSPAWIQNVIISIYGLIIFQKRYGKAYRYWFNYYIQKNYSNYEEELIYQESEFLSFLNFAVTKSKFYKNLYKDINLKAIKSLSDLSMLPIVEKELLRSHINEVYTIEEKDAITSFTGGTTGKSLQVRFLREDFQKRMAYLDAFKYRLGINQFKIKKATFSGRSLVFNNKSRIFWRYNFIYKQRLYSTFHLTQENIPFYISDLNKYKPEVLNGFVSALYELAEYIRRNQVELQFTPKAIFTTSETLLPTHRVLIEAVFECKIYNQYASAEGAPFITECKSGNLHYNLDTGIIEKDENNQMIVTSFTSRGTPLIRYNIGDLIEFKDGRCNCGSSHPLVEKIEGRKVDFLISESKGKISLSHLADVIKGNPNSIVNMQFIQNKIDHIDVLLMVDESLFIPEHAEIIIRELKYRFGDEMTINLKKVQEIPKEKSGKYSLIKNNLIQLKE